jgi:(E)-4-hydroxy-3-methylbut-2-enyl-diphosphate synthase
LDYHQFVFSMKASNPKVMIEAYRLLVARLRELGADWNYPLHLGVTEAGDGEDGRIKSAIGMGSLLTDGIGDTVRVSLTEDAVFEIPVARALVESVALPLQRGTSLRFAEPACARYDSFSYERRASQRIDVQGVATGGGETVRVAVTPGQWAQVQDRISRLGDFQPEIIWEKAGLEVDPLDDAAIEAINAKSEPTLVAVVDGCPLDVVRAYRLLAAKLEARHPILLKDRFAEEDSQALPGLLRAATHLGSLLCDGIGDAVLVRNESTAEGALRLAYNILQAAGVRIFKTDYVACPSCGRTLFNLQSTTQKIRAATGHLKGVRIAVMGCIVNGPGEMADADFGYVGGAPGKINLYVGKAAVKFNIPEEEAVERLIDLIREHDRWFEPAAEAVAG